MLNAIDCGAEDFSSDDDCYEVLTSAADFSSVREALEAKGYTFIQSQIDKIPTNTVAVTEVDKFYRMMDMFDDNDDVQQVYHNGEIEE